MADVLIISSKDNGWFRRFREAIDHHDDEIVLEGPKQVSDAIGRGWRPIAVAVSADTLFSADAPRLEFSQALIRRLSETVTSQEVLGLFERPRHRMEDLFADPSRPIVVLDRVQDSGNVGSIIRLCAAFQAAGIALTPGSADPLGPKVIRASAGTVLHVPVWTAEPSEIRSALDERGYKLFAAMQSTRVRTDLPSERFAIALGNEGHGLAEPLTRGAQPISIPMSDDVESLNVASAAAILLAQSYQTRQA